MGVPICTPICLLAHQKGVFCPIYTPCSVELWPKRHALAITQHCRVCT
ncbi:hypothetical protein HanPI659440_Chr17g0669901 [Helianthus annuus]|nr:hypothetical protein HanPI659440_Chr17g0669901 [Helianthus annuus]